MKKRDIVKKVGSKFQLQSHGGKVLGEHATEAEARQQETAINIAKARAAGHKIEKPQDLADFLRKQDTGGGSEGDDEGDEFNAGDPDLAVEGLPRRVGSRWIIMRNGEVAGQYDLVAESMHLQEGFANPNLMQRGDKRHDCHRYDVGQLRKPTVTPEGWLRADGFFTRTGVFEYKNQDGTVRRELRKPEDVFHPGALESFSMVPITDGHPPEFLTSNNTNQFQKGHVGENIVQDGKFVRGAMLITHADLVEKLTSKKMDEISCGYTCDTDETPGVTDTGDRYDAVQRNIRGNHVAIVPVGRAGGDARVHMDSRAFEMIPIHTEGGNPPAPLEADPVKIKIDGKEYEAGSKEAADAMAAANQKLDSLIEKQVTEVESARKEAKEAKDGLEKMKAKADAAEEQAKKGEQEKKDAATKAVSDFKARQELEVSARVVLGAKEKLDGLSDQEIKLKVLKSSEPELKLDGKPTAYVDARFDIAIERASEEREDARGGGVTAARQLVIDNEDEDFEPGDPRGDEMTEEEANKPHADSATAYDAMLWRHRNAHKQPLQPTRDDLRK